VDERHEQALAAERDALVGFVSEEVLVRGRQLFGERQRGFRGFQGGAGQRMR